MIDVDDKVKLYEAAVEFLNDEGYDAEVREDYSGRGMYGKTTPAIVTEAPAALVGYAIGLVAEDLALTDCNPKDLVPVRSDNMGLQMVYY